MNWKPGDIAILVGDANAKCQKFIGGEVEIVGPYNGDYGPEYDDHEWHIKCHDFHMLCCSCNLKPRPGKKSTWEDVQRITGWSPMMKVDAPS